SSSEVPISIPLGIFIGLLASFIQSLGLTIQRKSNVLDQQLPAHEQRVAHRRPLWLVGFLIFISSNLLGSLVQIASLPVVILAPLGAVSLLWNAFLARIILGDVFSLWMVVGTVLIAGGAVLIAFFGIVPEATHSLEDLLALFRRPVFIAYISLLCAVVFLALAMTHLLEFSLARRARSAKLLTSTSTDVFEEPQPSVMTTGFVENVSEAVNVTERTPLLDASERTPLLDRKYVSSGTSSPHGIVDGENRRLERARVLLAISYASFSGILSGMCLIFAKSGVELLILTLHGQNQFWRWETWVLVLSLGVFALLQLWYLQKGLMFAGPTLVCPSAFCWYNVSSIFNGLIYFDQFSMIPPLHLGLVVIGMVILLAGVWVVSMQSDGGVDVVYWDEDDSSSVSSDEVNDSLLSLPFSVSHDAANTIRLERTMPSSPQSEEPVVGLGLNISPSAPQSIVLPPMSPPERESQLEDQLPMQSHRGRPTTDSHRHHRHSRNSYSISHPPSSPPLIPPGGLQIGISAVSPGFSVTPERRRRRVTQDLSSSMTERLALGDAAPESYAPPQDRRRTVSEGNI
ncbi:hypothetical protein FISHEDRAFT_10010, partial [Fistulina hepatica ATCC 64428]